ncbi:hypothetical protein [Mangrovicoccus sp. HB161399]|uniref:hypothetical protein n=1 Tax=Mangrovicoccus sp. HB161399 TaxID=2720392 RepID=UPI001554C1E8|nr:hypothetical protein [Mangrovicoccus sp. HB161399]
MKRTVMSSLLAAALVGSAAIPALAESPRAPAGQAQMHDHRIPPKGNPEMAVAERLSTLETLIGVTPGQEPAWRAYTVALLDFFETGHPGPMGGPGPKPGAAPGADAPPHAEGAPEGAQAPAPRPLMAEMMADRAIARAQAAETLKQAVEGLKSALTDDQLAKLAMAEMPPHGAPHDGQRPDMPGKGGPRPDGQRPAQPPAAQ